MFKGRHNGKTHDATKLAPIMNKYPKSKRAIRIPQHGDIRAFIGDTAKKIAKQRHKKKSRSYHKKMCELID